MTVPRFSSRNRRDHDKPSQDCGQGKRQRRGRDPRKEEIGGSDVHLTLRSHGSPGRTRTSDQAVNSRSLYQLSYRGSERLMQARASVYVLRDIGQRVGRLQDENIRHSEELAAVQRPGCRFINGKTSERTRPSLILALPKEAGRGCTVLKCSASQNHPSYVLGLLLERVTAGEHLSELRSEFGRTIRLGQK